MGPCSEVKFFDIEMSSAAVTPSVCSSPEYFNWEIDRDRRGTGYRESDGKHPVCEVGAVVQQDGWTAVERIRRGQVNGSVAVEIGRD